MLLSVIRAVLRIGIYQSEEQKKWEEIQMKWKQIWKQATCGLLLTGILATSANAAVFTDTTNHWAKSSISRWSDYGVVGGYHNGNFGPNDPITRAQMAVILSRVFGWQEAAENIFHDINGSEWYAASILKAKAAGVLHGDSAGNARPNDPITRQEAAVMLSRALHVSGKENGKIFRDNAQIGAWALPAINGMTENGYINGSNDGNFHPARTITRAETVTILDRAIANYYNRAGTYCSSTSGITVIAASGVTLRDMTVNGTLIIAPGAGRAETVLKNVTVTGQTYVLSGKEAEVVFSGCKFAEIHVDGTNARIEFQKDNQTRGIEISGDGAVIRGLSSDQAITVIDGTSGVRVNGHDVQPGTITAGKDISSGFDDVEIDIAIGGGGISSGSGSSGNSGSSTGTGNSGNAGGSGSGGVDGGGSGEGSSGGTGSGGTTQKPDGGSSGSTGSGNGGGIIIDFGDLIKP